jgi:dihydrofolate reductase
MRKILLQLAVSLDGYIEDEMGAFDWCFTDQDYGMSEFLKRIDTLFMGRKSYDISQSMAIDPDDPYLRSIAHIKQYVFTQNKDLRSDQVQFISGDIIHWIKEFQSRPGQDIWLFGGAELISTLIEHRLVDEMILAVHPVLLGGGKSLITHQSRRIQLQLLSSTPYSTGLVMLTYKILY